MVYSEETPSEQVVNILDDHGQGQGGEREREREFYIFPQVFFLHSLPYFFIPFSFTGLSTLYSQNSLQNTKSINTKIFKTVSAYSKPIQHNRKKILFTTGAIRGRLME